MKLWTMQRYPAYKCILRTGILAANEEYVFEKDFYKPVFDWLYKM